ncbi:hypothetical protein [Pseudomonas sp. BBP2017]|uniref:hypothetical protein n=1 Tax=Pseudomonas sp. BBP2017 TaxID=2109731 RepID=UPI000D13D653|nr:hypothetical protein [Pseudomonas sp. BBP2017]PSS58942.1 hypothetical protein C6382_00805 [Pseudomonas sp. BBP2017]
MTKSPGFGPFLFRLPIAPGDRGDIDTPVVADGSTLAGWPEEALVIKGTWQPDNKRSLMLRPVFPGALQFLADDPVPSPEAIDVDAQGSVTSAGLKACALTGKLYIRIRSGAHLEDMKKCGTLPAIGVAPIWAAYGPVKLGPNFLADTLLGRNNGLYRRPVTSADGEQVPPTDSRWEALALHAFLSGAVGPNLLYGTSLNDDAAKLAMPELVIGTDKSFAVGIAFGWLRDASKDLPTLRDKMRDKNVEIVPALPFIRHIGKEVLEAAKDSLVDRIFEGEDDSKGWHARLRAVLMAMGFGDLGGNMPIEAVVREFQIAASARVVAKAKDPEASVDQLAERDFRDLVAVANGAHYKGPISGRANQETRRLIREWARLGQRSPLIIAAYSGLSDAKLEVPNGKAADHADLWRRKETEDNKLRMFAADFTRLRPGVGLDENGLELIGYYGPYDEFKTGGPASLRPTPARHVFFAEFRPGRIGLDESKLAAAKRNDPLYPAASTFRVIRAVSEIECLGHLDQINALDDAGISYGPCHWSMAKAKDNAANATEFGALSAYLFYLDKRGASPGVDVLARQGFRPFLSTETQALRAVRENSNGAFKWRLGLIDDLGESRQMTLDDVLNTVPSWRNFYRWVDIGRRDQLIGPPTWTMALRRLHQLMTVSFPSKRLTALHKKEMAAPTLSSVFTSELAVAILMRWHVKWPNHIVETKKVGDQLLRTADDHIVRAYAAAAKVADPAKRDAWQLALVDALKTESQKVDYRLEGDFDKMIQQPWWNDPKESRGHEIDRALTTLDSAHGSFVLLGPDPGP